MDRPGEPAQALDEAILVQAGEESRGKRDSGSVEGISLLLDGVHGESTVWGRSPPDYFLTKLEPMMAPTIPVTTGLQVHIQVLPNERIKKPRPAPSTPPMTAKMMVFFMAKRLAQFQGAARLAEKCP